MAATDTLAPHPQFGQPMLHVRQWSPGTPDAANFGPGTPFPPDNFCSQNAGYVPISQGNYVVHDRPVTDLLGLDQLLAQFESAANDPYG